MKRSQNTKSTGQKRPAPPTAWKPGQSGNPGGRPKNQRSITYWMHEFGNETPQALAERCLQYANELRRVKGSMTMFEHIALRTLMGLINEPEVKLLAEVLDRTEGKVSQPVDVSWRDLAKESGFDPDALVNDLFSKVKHDSTLGANSEPE